MIQTNGYFQVAGKIDGIVDSAMMAGLQAYSA